MKLPLMEVLLDLYRHGRWAKEFTDISMVDVLLKKGYCDQEFGYYFINRRGLILLADIGAIQV